VRPEDWRTLEIDAEGKLIISVMAGIRLSSICDQHNTIRVVRSLPNAAAEVRKSYTPWVSTSAVSDGDRAIVRSIFDTCGIQDELSSERDIDYLTGLAGSGPAFPAMLASAMMKHAMEYGLSAEVAVRAINMVIVGAGRLAEERGDVPEDLVDKFLKYRGTTAAAIEIMRAKGFEQSVAGGLEAAFEKSLAMG
jgi:pyrroline-5-carboxylate reductase